MGKKGGGRVIMKQMGPKGGGMMNPLADMAQQEPIILPTKPDSTTTYFYPRNQAYSMNYKNNSNFNCIWPTYIDASKTVKEGRRIGKERSINCPTVEDISEVLQDMGVRHVMQPFKGYPRDVESRWDNPGRVLYDMTQMERNMELRLQQLEHDDDDDDDNEEENDNDNGNDSVPNLDDDDEFVVTQKSVWKIVSGKIEGMPGRKQRLEEKKRLEEEEKKRLRDEARMRAVVSKKTATSSGSKKKGKKKR
mmetsp:Transcript_17060/g.25064  ORF Transcript_17060/g.25064 Transcript_17060/m.25064 type:complete len:249 (+) Transcript_17060:125-871(+)|eukprot:CAMPEP_0194075832 /NCGR_PEP_ID=MMETSP0149-20130528/2754_1 /TAXON_ID=122233 /ORGANISM="Chaetoceros debilis, Strain MM31A-1" /LENGTH=248 /DNA_ID=CAMNT_0038756417 /DNA_START=35 /DNA_END=781 /DNA_ORIENTATION=+